MGEKIITHLASENRSSSLLLSSPVFQSPLQKVIVAVVIYKFLFLLFVFGSLDLLPIYNVAAHEIHRHLPLEGEPNVTSSLTTWDGAHYLHLSKEGYKRNDPSCAFYPLLPLLIKAVSPRGSTNVIQGIIICNAFSIVAIVLFYALVTSQYGAETAKLSLILLLSFPGAIFFSFIYTESLFLLLIIVFFIALFRNKYWLVAVTGFLLPLSRAVGVFCILPLMWHLWSKHREKDTFRSQSPSPSPNSFVHSFKVSRWLACFAPLLGYASYFVFMSAVTGNSLEGFEAQKYYPNHPSILNIINVPGFLRSFVEFDVLHGMTDSAIDRVLFVLFLCCLPRMWRLNKSYFFYALGSGLVPALSNRFFSYNRFIILCFPVFIVLADRLKGTQNQLLFWYVVAVMASIQILFLIRHINFYWAG